MTALWRTAIPCVSPLVRVLPALPQRRLLRRFSITTALKTPTPVIVPSPIASMMAPPLQPTLRQCRLLHRMMHRRPPEPTVFPRSMRIPAPPGYRSRRWLPESPAVMRRVIPWGLRLPPLRAMAVGSSLTTPVMEPMVAGPPLMAPPRRMQRHCCWMRMHGYVIPPMVKTVKPPPSPSVAGTRLQARPLPALPHAMPIPPPMALQPPTPPLQPAARKQ